jgi:hypothetical protein
MFGEKIKGTDFDKQMDAFFERELANGKDFDKIMEEVLKNMGENPFEGNRDKKEH